MKLYTKRGDLGLTDLFGGGRVGKDNPRVGTYGSVDELNSAIGLAACACDDESLSAILTEVQGQLFEVGAELASPPQPETEADVHHRSVRGVGPAQIRELEKHIDRTCEHLPPMRSFILPGGSDLAARLHLARTVCRRAERECVALSRIERIRPDLCVYLNRLSDLLFALARKANQIVDVDDVAWVAPGA